MEGLSTVTQALLVNFGSGRGVHQVGAKSPPKSPQDSSPSGIPTAVQWPPRNEKTQSAPQPNDRARWKPDEENLPSTVGQNDAFQPSPHRVENPEAVLGGSDLQLLDFRTVLRSDGRGAVGLRYSVEETVVAAGLWETTARSDATVAG